MTSKAGRTELIVALDVADREQALRFRDQLTGVVEWFKIGKELFTAEGPSIVREFSDERVFLDLKFHDIPNTVAGAIRSASRLGVDILDVHASGGLAMMRSAVQAAKSADDPSPKVFAVTVLTSLDAPSLAELGVASSPEQQVIRLAKLALEAGLDGVVASAREIAAIREATSGRLELLIPGIRPEWAGTTQDQARVATPYEVAKAGASFIVVGRPIREHPDPREAALRIREELERGGADG